MAIEKYNAFISYRHSELDSRIAALIQRQLEHYDIPRKLQKKTGIKRFERIFLDKEELLTTSDINNDITQAIMNSEFLIVICSTHTAESIWVEKEIETFLMYHPKSNILTVLADGAVPSEVIPEVLQHDTVTRYLADGNVVTYDELMEPLSCDYRMKDKKTRKRELARLAAALLGCSYDELLQRRRQYERRRAAAVLSAAFIATLAFAGYMAYSSIRIRNALDAAERSRSIYLASESQKLLEQDDRLGAVQLALYGVPDKPGAGDEMTESIKALSDAMHCYVGPGSLDIEATWKYEMKEQIKDYEVSDDGTYLAAVDTGGNIAVWGTGTREKAFAKNISEISDISISGDTLVIVTAHSFIGLDIVSGDEKWRDEFDHLVTYSSGDRIVSYEDDLLICGADRISWLDPSDGSAKREIIYEDYPEVKSALDEGFTAYDMKAGGGVIELDGKDTSDNTWIFEYDTNRDAFRLISRGEGYIGASYVTPDGDIVIATSTDAWDSSYSFGSKKYLKEDTRSISCYSGTDLNWKVDIKYSGVVYKSRIFEYKFLRGGVEVPAIAALFAEKLAVIDKETGEVLMERTFSSTYADVFGYSNAIGVVLRDGSYVSVIMSDETDTMASADYFFSDCVRGVPYADRDGYGAYLMLQDSDDCIIEYSKNAGDPGYQEIGGALSYSDDIYISDYLMTEDDILVIYNTGRLEDYNVHTMETKWKKDLGGDRSIDLKGYDSKGNFYAVITDLSDYTSDLVRVMKDTGDMKGLSLTDVSLNTEMIIINDKLHIFGYDPEGSKVSIFDLADGSVETKIFKISDEDRDAAITSGYGVKMSPDGRYAAYMNGSSGLISIYDIENEKASVYRDQGLSAVYEWNEAGDTLAVLQSDRIVLLGADAEEKGSIDIEDKEVSSIGFKGDELLVVYVDNTLAVYSLSGETLRSISLTPGDHTLKAGTRIISAGDKIFIDGGTYCYILRQDTYKCEGWTAFFMGYSDAEERLLVKSYKVNTSCIIGYDYYSPEELIKKAEEFTQGYEMSEKDKKAYGLE